MLVELFLAPVTPGAAFDGAVQDAASRLRATLPASANVTNGRRIDDPVRPRMEAAGMLFDDEIGGYLAVTLGSGEHRDPLVSAVDSLRDLIHPGASRVAGSALHPVIDGHGRIALFHLLRRKDGLSRQEFLEYWSGGHTRFSRTIPGLEAYIQHHVDPDESAALAGQVGIPGADFDGVATTYSSSVEAYVEHMGRSQSNEGVKDNDVFVAVGQSPYITLWELDRTG